MSGAREKLERANEQLKQEIFWLKFWKVYLPWTISAAVLVGIILELATRAP